MTAPHDERVAALRLRLTESSVHAAVLAPGSDLRYLTGYDALPLERPTLLLVTREGPARIVVPRLERMRAQAEVSLSDLVVVDYGEHDDALGLAAELLDASEAASIAVGDRTWTSFTLGLQRALPGRSWCSATELVAHGRRVKDALEVERLAAVAARIDDVHRRVPDVLVAGRTEAEVAADLSAMITEEHERVDFVIVASGPNAASPHHEPGERRLQRGDAVVVDIGGTRDGYCSDMTRTYAVGSVPEGFAEPYAALRRAQQAAIDAVRPGATVGDVDAAARDVLEAAGLGEAFVHRTGHGIGLDTHEEPWIIGGGTRVLEPGMAFSVEPGFYLEGRFGARIEDIVVVTTDGVRVLNVVDRDLVVVP